MGSFLSGKVEKKFILGNSEYTQIKTFFKDMDFPARSKYAYLLILGNEAHGISSSIQSRLTHRISIPGYGDMESLNVAVAGGILLQSLTCKKSVTN